MPNDNKEDNKISVLDEGGKPLTDNQNGDNQNGDNSGIVCDFSGIPRRWSKRMTRLYAEVMTASVISMAEQDKKASDKMKFEFMKEKALAAHTVADADDEMEALLTQVIVSVDRRWLHNDAPDDLDWNEPESLGWITDSLHAKFVKAIMEQRVELTKQAKN